MKTSLRKNVIFKTAFILAMIVVLLVGCQSVGGFNLNKALVSNMTVQSAEGNLSFSIELDLNEDQIDESDAAIAKLFSSMRIDIDQLKMEDLYTLSAKGTLHIYKGEVPFSVLLTEDELAIQVDGAEKPIVINLSSQSSVADEYNMGMTGMGSLGLMPGMDTSMFEDMFKGKELALYEALGNYFYGNLQNPNTIQLERESLTINGEQLNLQKIHAEIYGDELVEWLRQTLENFVADKEGLKTLISTVYDLAKPFIDEMLIGMAEDPYMDEFSLGLITKYLENKTLVVEFLYTTIEHLLEQALVYLDNMIVDMEAEIGNFLTRDTYLKTDMYFDNNLMMRKFNIELVVALPEEVAEVNQIKIQYSGEQWNLNGDVKADVIDVSDSFAYYDDTNPAEVLSWFDSDSIAYDILANDFKITRQVVYFYMTDKESASWYAAYKKDRQTMIPIRNLARQMGYEMTWNTENKSTVIYDSLTGNTLEIQTGSSEALVNGEPVQMLTAAEIHAGSLYVPLLTVTETFDLKKDWDPVYEEVIIIRE